jgi:4-amino-4-deoxy-L-arabinose transferase-like glycosyltransferase
MAIGPMIQVRHAGALASVAGQRRRWVWPYTANLLFLLYLAWAASHITSGMTRRETWAAIPLVVGFVYLGVRLNALAPRIRIAIAAALAFTLYHLWGLYTDVTPFSDFLSFYHESIDFMTMGLGAALKTKSPTTIAWYGSVLWLLGPSYSATYVAAAVLWAAQIPLLYAALAAFDVRDATAKTAALVYGFSPSVVFYAPLITSESVFNFLIVLCLYVLSRYHRRAALRTAAALGATSALLFLTRMNGIAFMIAFALYVAVWPGEMRQRLAPLASLLATFLLIVILNAYATSRYTGHFSLMPSTWGAYNFMVGTNRVYNGGYNTEDLALAGYPALSQEEASRNALRIGIERITTDPLGFVAFAFTDKLKRFWGTDGPSVEWPTHQSPTREALVDTGIIPLAERLTQAFRLFLNLTAELGLIWCLASPRRRAERLSDQLTFVVVLPMLLLSLLHVFIEVQPRYHIPYLPLLCTLSALSLSVLGKRLPFAPKAPPSESQRRQKA